MKAESHNLAVAEQRLEIAQAAEKEAQDHVHEIDQRIEETGSRLAKIKTDMQSGSLNEAQAGGLFAIAREDESDLIELRQAALAKLAEAAATRQQAENECNQAQHALELSGRQQAFNELSVHVKAVEACLCRAVGELFILGRGIGNSAILSGSWVPCDELRRAVLQGVPPTSEAQR